MYEYNCQVLRIVDGDTIEVNIELGFDISLQRQKVRLYGLDTAESRTKNKFENWVGEFTSAALRDWVSGHSAATLHSREFAREKYGRILGDINFYDPRGEFRSWSTLMRDSGLAVSNGWTKEHKKRYWDLMYNRLFATDALDQMPSGHHSKHIYVPNNFIWPSEDEIRELIDESADKD